jgi:hypothetical protein
MLDLPPASVFGADHSGGCPSTRGATATSVEPVKPLRFTPTTSRRRAQRRKRRAATQRRADAWSFIPSTGRSLRQWAVVVNYCVAGSCGVPDCDRGRSDHDLLQVLARRSLAADLDRRDFQSASTGVSDLPSQKDVRVSQTPPMIRHREAWAGALMQGPGPSSRQTARGMIPARAQSPPRQALLTSAVSCRLGRSAEVACHTTIRSSSTTLSG